MLGVVQGKVWGHTQCLLVRNNTEIHRIVAVPGGYSSIHKHNSKFNMFYVESGELQVKIYHDNGLVDVTVLTDGMSTIVNPGVSHQFVALAKSVVYEIYWVELNQDDIVRKTQGGVDA